MATNFECDISSSSRDNLNSAADQYRNGMSRGRVFRDLVMEGIRRFDQAVVLDIGCGRGLGHDDRLQSDIAAAAGRMLGVEPDDSIKPPACFDMVHRTTLEDASIEPDSVHVAYAFSVLEHIRDPDRFWQTLYRVLVPGGIFCGITPDARHPFCAASTVMGWMGLKDHYLNWVRKRPRGDRYENYPTFYRSNSPRAVRQQASEFHVMEFVSLHRPGQLRFYFPAWLRPVVSTAERGSIALGLPGSLLIMQLEKSRLD